MSQASIPPPALTGKQALHDLCAYPEYIEAILEEALTVMEEDGDLSQKTLYRMRKLDSFMKKSQRANPPQLRKSSHQEKARFKGTP
jgi:hypothetical protein